jgi:predicted protein tyrosine phosphatase
MWDISLGLGISALPTRSSLALFRTLGFSELINVSGTVTSSLYTPSDLAGLMHADFSFTDALSSATDAAAIIEALGPEGMREIKNAVEHTAACLRAHRAVMVFCHLGVGRSPVVATMALMLARQCSVEEAARIVTRLRPKAALHEPVLAFAKKHCGQWQDGDKRGEQ